MLEWHFLSTFAVVEHPFKHERYTYRIMPILLPSLPAS